MLSSFTFLHIHGAGRWLVRADDDDADWPDFSDVLPTFFGFSVRLANTKNSIFSGVYFVSYQASTLHISFVISQAKESLWLFGRTALTTMKHNFSSPFSVYLRRVGSEGSPLNPQPPLFFAILHALQFVSIRLCFFVYFVCMRNTLSRTHTHTCGIIRAHTQLSE